MKILVKDEGKTVLRLWLPSSLIKSRLWVGILRRKTNYPEDEIRKIQACMKDAYRHLKTYIKKYGHFTLVEAQSDDSYVHIQL